MKYAGIEYMKIVKSPAVIAATFIQFVAVGSLFIGFLVKKVPVTGLEFVSSAIGNLLNLGIFQLLTAVTAGASYGYEYSCDTMKYVLARPVGMGLLYAGKFTACMLHLVLTALLLVAFSACAAFPAWRPGALIDSMGNAIDNPAVRLALFYGFTILNQVFLVALAGMAAIFTKRHATGMIVAYCVYVLMLMFTPDRLVPYSPLASFGMKRFLVTPDVDFYGLLSCTGITLAWSAVPAYIAMRRLMNNGRE